MNKINIQHLYIYPIKALGSVAVNNWPVLKQGMLYDRVFMLINENNKFVSQRNFPQLSLVKIDIEEEILDLRFGSDTLQIPLFPCNTENTILCHLWKSKVPAHPVGKQYDRWFSDLFGSKLRLVRIGKELRQKSKNISTNFQDGYPLLLVNLASVRVLDLREQDHNRFRPNIVVDTGQAFSELNTQSWYFDGDVEIKLVKPCVRCPVVNIDQTTGKISTQILDNIQRNHQKSFGVNCEIISSGNLEIKLI